MARRAGQVSGMGGLRVADVQADPQGARKAMERTYAAGDIHGSLGKLQSLVALCERDAGGRPATFVFLGDYIDRGPDSRGVIEFLMAMQARPAGKVIPLMGNHEAVALEAAESSMRAGNWLAQGGAETLQSYGVSSVRELPRKHIEWLRSLRLMYDDGRRLFVHAGVDPEKALDDQHDADLLWIREPFLSDARNYGRLIVHGHTPTKTGKPDQRINRLNLDTGAVYGRALTAAVFTDEETEPVAFLQASK
jgi:serine/threonine protein phosphatase 1